MKGFRNYFSKCFEFFFISKERKNFYCKLFHDEYNILIFLMYSEIIYASQCGIGNLTVPNGTNSNNEYAQCTSYTGSIIIPSSLTYIVVQAFLGCTGFNDSLIIRDSVTFIGYQAFCNCTNIIILEFNCIIYISKTIYFFFD